MRPQARPPGRETRPPATAVSPRTLIGFGPARAQCPGPARFHARSESARAAGSSTAPAAGRRESAPPLPESRGAAVRIPTIPTKTRKPAELAPSGSALSRRNRQPAQDRPERQDRDRRAADCIRPVQLPADGGALSNLSPPEALSDVR